MHDTYFSNPFKQWVTLVELIQKILKRLLLNETGYPLFFLFICPAAFLCCFLFSFFYALKFVQGDLCP